MSTPFEAYSFLSTKETEKMWITGAKQLDDWGCSRWMDCACADGKSAAVGWDRCGWVAGGRQLKQLEPVVQ